MYYTETNYCCVWSIDWTDYFLCYQYAILKPTISLYGQSADTRFSNADGIMYNYGNWCDGCWRFDWECDIKNVRPNYYRNCYLY